MNETDATQQRSVQEAIDTIPDGLVSEERATAVNLDTKLEMSRQREPMKQVSTRHNNSEPRHEARDESVVRTDDEDAGRTR